MINCNYCQIKEDKRVAKNMGVRERKRERAENKNPGGGGDEDMCKAWVGPTRKTNIF
jgi:hypothetical protein